MYMYNDGHKKTYMYMCCIMYAKTNVFFTVYINAHVNMYLYC